MLLGVHVSTASATQAGILVLGDSISAAYGMDLEQGWVAALQDRVAGRAAGWTVANASISGDTTGGGLQRLPRLLEQHQPTIVILELGGNDGLRGFPINQLRANLTAMVKQSQDAGASVLLLTMEIPPNFGKRYTGQFRDSFAQVAASTGARVADFILDGIATRPELMQDDGIHPTAEAQPMIVDNVWPHLLPLIEQHEASIR